MNTPPDKPMPTRLPDSVAKYSETPIFDEQTVPAKVTSVHTTKAGVWGKLVVSEGALDYIVIGPPERRQRISAGNFGVIEPQTEHRVETVGPVRFKVEFYRSPESSA